MKTSKLRIFVIESWLLNKYNPLYSYRRGHDNTGVTDRVVNQLLTQLDGVEGLEGRSNWNRMTSN